MTDSTSPSQAVFNIQRIYVQDMSLEQPHSPHIFLETAPPSAELHVHIEADALQETIFQVSLTLTLTTTIAEKVALIVELKQTGIFEIQNFPPEELDPTLYISCPSILFGYARANMADAITRAGFPAVHLSEINFPALYEHRQAAAANIPTPESTTQVQAQ
jgi:preprotein translocase subunit SecB